MTTRDSILQKQDYIQEFYPLFSREREADIMQMREWIITQLTIRVSKKGVLEVCMKG